MDYFIMRAFCAATLILFLLSVTLLAILIVVCKELKKAKKKLKNLKKYMNSMYNKNAGEYDNVQR